VASIAGSFHEADDQPAKDEPTRLAALATFQILDTPTEPEFDELVAIAASLCETPLAYLSFIDRDRQWFKSCCGASLETRPRRTAICDFTVSERGMVIIPDLAAHGRFAHHPLVADGPRWRFYAGVPLMTGPRLAIGTLVVVDYRPRLLRTDQQRNLQTLAAQVMAQLDLRVRLQREKAENDGPVAARKEAERLLASVIDLRDRSVSTEVALLSSREVARIFNVSTRTIGNWVSQRRLPAIQTGGGHYRFDVGAVLDLLVESRSSCHSA
jgi:excisionase family DNA binding protein